MLPAGIDWLRSVGPYEGALREILHALKYDGRQTLAPRLAACATTLLRTLPSRGSATMAVPVPLHRRKSLARGYNQAELIARGLALPAGTLLRRRLDTPSQTALDRDERRRSVRDAFALTPRQRPGALHGSEPPGLGDLQVLLVDDVMTTGATLSACAHVLRRAGVRHVAALTIARTA